MILVTGGSGLVGRHIIQGLRLAHRPVLAMARSDQAAAEVREVGATVLPGDVTDPAIWSRVDGVEAIIHSAASVFTRGNWADYQRTNVDATRLAAQRARQLGVPLVHISSIAVYRHSNSAVITEQSSIGSVTDGEVYSRSKRLAEVAVWEAMAGGLTAVILRPSVVYGEGDRLFLPRLLQLADRGWFPLPGGGGSALPMVYAGNVADGVIAALDTPSSWGKAFNLTNDGLVTGRDLVAALAAGLHRPVRPVTIPLPIARVAASLRDSVRPLVGRSLPPLRGGVAFLSSGNRYSSRSAHEVLGWRRCHRHAEALPRSVRWVADGI